MMAVGKTAATFGTALRQIPAAPSALPYRLFRRVGVSGIGIGFESGGSDIRNVY
jgi:hypothetical protein